MINALSRLRLHKHYDYNTRRLGRGWGKYNNCNKIYLYVYINLSTDSTLTHKANKHKHQGHKYINTLPSQIHQQQIGKHYGSTRNAYASNRTKHLRWVVSFSYYLGGMKEQRELMRMYLLQTS